jgi:hypothetical protein
MVVLSCPFSVYQRMISSPSDELAGEEVVAQVMLIGRYGGCGILPGRAAHRFSWLQAQM